MRTELAGLELVLHRLTTLRLMMATSRHRSIERAAAELEDALAALTDAESSRRSALVESGHRRLADVLEDVPEPMRSDLDLLGARLRRAQQEVRVAASATGSMAARSLGQVRAVLREAGATDEIGLSGYDRVGALSGLGVPGRMGFVEGSI